MTTHTERAIVEPSISSDTAGNRNEAAIRLLDAWLREDAATFVERWFSPRPVEHDSWEQLKEELDRDRPSARKLFR